MYVFIDESGTFSKTNEPGSYCVVGAIVLPESSFRSARTLLTKLKVEAGFSSGDEVKIKDLDERTYRRWMRAFSKLDMIGIAAATDSAFNTTVAEHKAIQAANFDSAAEPMHYAEGRAGVRALAERLRAVSDQNYAEMLVRTLLTKDVVELGAMYYAQRKPGALGKFRWFFDGKAVGENKFESTLRDIVPSLLQSVALQEGFHKIEGGNYAHFDKSFDFQGDASWLPRSEDQLGPPSGLSHIGRIWRTDLDFVRSHDHFGVQIADLFVSGIRRALRGAWTNNEAVASDIGSLMVQRTRNVQGLRMVALDQCSEGRSIESVASLVIQAMREASRPMLVSDR